MRDVKPGEVVEFVIARKRSTRVTWKPAINISLYTKQAREYV